MKVLILSSRIPFPANNGYAIVVYNTVEGLIREGVQVSLFCLNPTEHYVDVEDIHDPLLSKIDFQSVEIDVTPGIFDQLFSPIYSVSNNVFNYYSEQADKQLQQFLRYEKFDIIQIEGILMVPYTDTLFYQHDSAKVIYRTHQLEYAIWQNAADHEGFWPRKQYLRKLSSKLKALATAQFEKYDYIFTLTESDRFEILQLGCETPVKVMPLGIDLELYHPKELHTLPPTLFYLGTMEWLPNREGLYWFIQSVWPFVEQLNNDIRLYLAGKFTDKDKRTFDSDNIVIEGEVDNAVEFMNSHSIMIVPLHSGGGIQVKIIEGMAMKKCIIATPRAVQGIACKHGHDILIAETTDDFFRLILHCVANPKLWKKIGENAYETVQKHYESRNVSTNLIQVYQQIKDAPKLDLN